MTTDTTTQPFDTVARTLRTGAEMVAETLEADADWEPFVHPDGEYCGELVEALRRAFA